MAVAYRGLARDRPPSELASFRVMYGYIRPCRLPLLAGACLSPEVASSTNAHA
jgi:hypothetical protein